MPKKVLKKRKKYINLLDNRERERLPFNWCDKWCEKCDKSYKCKFFQEEQKRATMHSAEGRDPSDPDVILEDMHKDLEKLQKMLEKDMKKQGTDYKKMLKQASKLEVSFEEHHDFEIIKKAETYMQKVNFFIDVLYGRIQFNPYLSAKIRDDIEILNWYHTIIPIKLRRVLDSLWESKINGEEDELSLKDAYWTSDVVSKSINLSKNSLEKIIIYEPGSEKTIIELISILKDIEDEFIKIIDIGLGKHLINSVGKKTLDKSLKMCYNFMKS